jgi:hypothetical protein
MLKSVSVSTIFFSLSAEINLCTHKNMFFHHENILFFINALTRNNTKDCMMCFTGQRDKYR